MLGLIGLSEGDIRGNPIDPAIHKHDWTESFASHEERSPKASRSTAVMRATALEAR